MFTHVNYITISPNIVLKKCSGDLSYTDSGNVIRLAEC